jgi:hypothetical protein
MCARCGRERRGELPSRYERHRSVCLECLSPLELRQVAQDVDDHFALATLRRVTEGLSGRAADGLA